MRRAALGLLPWLVLACRPGAGGDSAAPRDPGAVARTGDVADAGDSPPIAECPDAADVAPPPPDVDPDRRDAAEPVERAATPPDAPAGDACDDSLDVRIFRSPRRPDATRPLRVIATSTRDPGPVALVLVDPGGVRREPPAHRLGGPPYTFWAEIDRPLAGEWTAVLGDGPRIDACKRIRVARSPARPEPRVPDVPAPAWTPSWKWERDTENLYSAFVEQLFRDPPDEEISWPDLQTLLRDPARNLFHDHLCLGEDEALRLVPDCADLPYFLRAYFAWKNRLPFAFRTCSRGRAGVPPICAPVPLTNLEPVDGADDLEAFANFVQRVANAVHSATARTSPFADDADLYPVPLSRETLPPGTVYADPYGHVIVVAAWLPQSPDRYGVLLGADAQPDGTVGRRRFWRGSFLFTPETTDVGSGFKAWRPVFVDVAAATVTVLTNDDLRETADYAPWSDEIYRGSADDFYDRMEALINPRPLDPAGVLVSLVDALEAEVARRVVSVDNGEKYVAGHSDRPIDMPEGYDLFETEGPWEDYSTPARDMRLLIAIDTVLGFPAAVERRPERFGLGAGAPVEPAVAALRERLAQELASRRFRYVRSDGSAQDLTLEQLVDRRVGLEVAYNPNDCVEVRWAAPEGSEESGTCRRRAPEEQRLRMEEYRSWFRARQRPPR